jgi:S1-C subfamily serine protease
VDNLILNRAPAASAASVSAVQPAAVRPSAKALVADDLQSRLMEIYETVNPAVVNIRVVAMPQSRANMPNLPDMPYAQGEGSGFVWDNQGYIVTNNHVVDGATKVSVTFADGVVVPATVVGTDPESDLAVIKVDPTAVKLQPIAVGDSNQVKVGQFVLAIGNPFGLAGSMSFGIVSALGRSLPASGESATLTTGPSYTIPDIIQTDAPVNPGNSGGVLLDLDGNLVGVPSAIESPVRGSTGVGFAIPSAIVKQVVPELIRNGKFVHPWIGISGGTLSPEVAQAMDLPTTQRGALVAAVTQDSPADKAGVRGSTQDATIDGQDVKVGGDVIVAIDGQPITRFEDLVTYLARNTKAGQAVELTVLRGGKEMSISLTLAARPSTKVTTRTQEAIPAVPQTEPRGNQQPPAAPRSEQGVRPNARAGGAWLGIAGIDLPSAAAEAMGLDADQTGALIQEVVPDSPADKAGLRAGSENLALADGNIKVGGDVIIEANGEAVESMRDVVMIVQTMKPGDKLNLTVLRDGKTVNVTVELAARSAGQ